MCRAHGAVKIRPLSSSLHPLSTHDTTTSTKLTYVKIDALRFCFGSWSRDTAQLQSVEAVKYNVKAAELQ